MPHPCALPSLPMKHLHQCSFSSLCSPVASPAKSAFLLSSLHGRMTVKAAQASRFNSSQNTEFILRLGRCFSVSVAKLVLPMTLQRPNKHPEPCHPPHLAVVVLGAGACLYLCIVRNKWKSEKPAPMDHRYCCRCFSRLWFNLCGSTGTLCYCFPFAFRCWMGSFKQIRMRITGGNYFLSLPRVLWWAIAADSVCDCRPVSFVCFIYSIFFKSCSWMKRGWVMEYSCRL